MSSNNNNNQSADWKSAAALQKLRNNADERYHVFVTTCATLLSLIAEERVFKVPRTVSQIKLAIINCGSYHRVVANVDEQVQNTLALSQFIQK